MIRNTLPMYFYHLPAFDPGIGVNTDKFNKHPFISSIDGLFEPNFNSFNFERPLPFDRIEIDENCSFFVSEPNLLKVFKNSFWGENPILVENAIPIKKEYTQELIFKFYSGYTDGLKNFKEELGVTYPALNFNQQKEVLRNFMQFCHEILYFEGFAIPEVIYSLGYIQANLVLAHKEYYNLKFLSTPEQSPIPADGFWEPSLSSLSPEQTKSNPISKKKTAESKILLKHPLNEIVDLWNILLDPETCHILEVPQVFHTEDQIHQLLGGMFKCSPDQATKLPETELHYLDMALNYQPLLSLLMHATYKLNYKHQRLRLKGYCELLVNSFSPFDNNSHLEGNITKKLDGSLKLVRKSTGEYAKKAYQILKKIPSYRLKD